MTNAYQLPIVNGQRADPVDLGWNCDVRFDASDNLPTYIGLHLINGAATTDLSWKIFKFTYSGSDTTRIQTAYGAWDSRASLGW